MGYLDDREWHSVAKEKAYRRWKRCVKLMENGYHLREPARFMELKEHINDKKYHTGDKNEGYRR
jgi:hypothetical protein